MPSNLHKQEPRSLISIAFLALCFAVLGIAGCGVEKGTSTLSNSATLVATPATVDFGSVNIGNSGNQKVSVANTGPDPVHITQFTVSDDAFNVDGEGTLPVNLAPGAVLNFKVHFNPKKSTDSTAELSLVAGTSTTAAATIKLHGKGASATNPATATLAGMTCANSSMTTTGSDACTLTLSSGAPSGGLAVTLLSSSTAVTVPSSVTITSGATSASFTAKVSAVSTSQTATITASDSSTSKTFALQLGPAPTSPAATPTLSALSCGSTSVAGAQADTCTVSLSGSAPTGGLSVALASSSSSVKVPGSITVQAAASSATFTANVSAVTTAQSVTLTATSGSTTKKVSLQLNTGTAALSINATSIAFGSTPLNTPTSQSLKLTSTGSGSVTVKSATITGAGFTASGQTFPLTLNPGQSVSLDLQFDPTTSGNATGQLTIVTNASSNSTAVVSLTGSSSAHKVSLNWDAPTGNDPIAGYNVYRAVAAATSYQRLNSRPNTDTTFTDSSVQSGQSYDYMVRSVDLSGVESKPSNKTTVTIP